MTTIKINEQIAKLRKQKGMTQEEMANALGVTNQAVSKWESAQCCPDIQLLPEIAELLDVSVDELLGHAHGAEFATQDIISAIRGKINMLQKGEDFNLIFRLAAALHTIIWSKEMTEQSDESLTDAIEHAGNAEWGYSSLCLPELTTTMRRGAVFFSNNKRMNIVNDEISRIISVMKPFGNASNLKAAVALYNLTGHSGEDFATAEQISDKSGLPVEKVMDCLMGELAPFVLEKESEKNKFRFKGMYMNIIPILSLLDFRC